MTSFARPLALRLLQEVLIVSELVAFSGQRPALL